MESTIVNTLVIAFTHKLIDQRDICYIPFHAVASVVIDKSGRARIRTKGGAWFDLDEKQAARLKQLLDAAAFPLDWER